MLAQLDALFCLPRLEFAPAYARVALRPASRHL